MTDREIELRSVFFGKVRQKLPRVLLVSLVVLLACVVVFGVVGVFVYVAVMVVLGLLLAAFGYYWWNARVMPILRKDEALRAQMAQRSGDGRGQWDAHGAAGHDYDNPGGFST